MYGDSKLFIYINKKNVIKTKLMQIKIFWSEILTLSFMYDWQNMYHFKFMFDGIWYAIQIY